jgi:hypothetical protein
MSIIKFENLDQFIIEIRDQKVLLDSDVASLYGVETKRVNEAVKNNLEKFPSGYVLSLSKSEWDLLKSKLTTSIPKGGKVKLPTAFTEKGLYMLATILKSKQSVEATLLIIETFSRLRELSRNIQALSNVKTPAEQKALMQKGGEMIATLLEDDLTTTDSETSFEINFAMLKFKHVIKKKSK